MERITFKNGAIEMVGNLYLPEGYTEGRTYPAIVCVHPGGGVKEQTSGLYAKKLTAEGFVTLAYDASHQGESGGEPRQLEDPYARVEDVRCAVDFLTTLGFVDRDRIGVLGLCAGGGYVVNAAMTDPRIKAVGGVSTVNFGAMYRAGWDGKVDTAQVFDLLEAAAQARTAEAHGASFEYMPLAPVSPEEVPHPEFREAYDYYRTARARHCNSPGVCTVRSLSQLVAYDAFHLADILLTRPLQLVAGSKAGSLWFSQDILERAASRDKNLHIVEGASHFDLYDSPGFVAEAVTNLAAFYRTKL